MKPTLVLFIGILFSFHLVAQQIRYDFSAPNAAHHEAEIVLTVNGLPAGPALFRMSRSSPGRYATHEFGKNVYNIKAVDEKGAALPVDRVEADVYRISRHKGTVKVSYTLYGNHADGTYAEIDPTHYHLNMPASFLWVKGLEKSPITIRFAVPEEGWTIATQLKPTSDPAIFSAPGLQYFMDSPTRITNQHWRRWNVTNPNGKQYTIRLALEAEATNGAVDTFAGNLQKLVREAQAVFGEVPSFDYGNYTFLTAISPYVKGDGMEHRNSTMISLPASAINITGFLEVFAHEFFHCWNVERIRPKSLEPFSFERSNVSEALWIAEGFTQYYGMLLMKRAGFTSDETFRQQMAGLIRGKEATPGGRYYTPIESSQMAVFVDAGVAVDRTNYSNIHTSYYTYGAALALALDLQLRQQFGSSMDAFMRELWKRIGVPEKPYTLAEVEKALAIVSTPGFAKEFFSKYVYDHQSFPYATMLPAAGWQVKKTAEGKAWLGNTGYKTENGHIVVSGNTLRNTPLYNAGVDVDDVLLQLDGSDLKTAGDVEAVLAKHQPGDRVKLLYSHRGRKKESEVVLGENPAFTVAPMESATEAQQAFQKKWVEGKAI